MFLQSHFNFILFFQSAFNIYSQFKTSCLPVTAPIWVCLDLTSDIHHLFASFCSLMKAQVRKNHQQAEPTGPLCIKDSITAMVIQERPPRNLSDNNAQRGKLRRKRLMFLWIPLILSEIQCLQDKLFLHDSDRQRALFAQILRSKPELRQDYNAPLWTRWMI